MDGSIADSGPKKKLHTFGHLEQRGPQLVTYCVLQETTQVSGFFWECHEKFVVEGKLKNKVFFLILLNIWQTKKKIVVQLA